MFLLCSSRYNLNSAMQLTELHLYVQYCQQRSILRPFTGVKIFLSPLPLVLFTILPNTSYGKLKNFLTI